jgi:hypothetical protein
LKVLELSYKEGEEEERWRMGFYAPREGVAEREA